MLPHYLVEEDNDTIKPYKGINMIRIDDSLLEEIGLISLPKPDRDQMLRQIYETLEMRVGMRLAERMTDQQLDEFERFIDTNDEAGALKWLESNFPDYKQVVADELNKLKEEIKKDSTRILEAMRNQPQQPAMAQPAQPNPAGAVPAQFGPTPNPVIPPTNSPAPANFGPAPQPVQSAAAPFQPPPQQPQPVDPVSPAAPGTVPIATPTPDPVAPIQPTPQQPFNPQPATQIQQSTQPQDDNQQNPSTDSQGVPPPPSF